MELYNEEIARLIRYELLGELSEKDRQKLERWRLESDEHEKLFCRIQKELRVSLEMELFCSLDDKKAWKEFQLVISERKKRRLRVWAYAAGIVCPLMLAGMFCFFKQSQTINESFQVEKQIVPGESRAVLFSAAGEVYELHGSQDVLEFEVEQGIFVKQKGGSLVYDTLIQTPINSDTCLNTLRIPRGGEFKVTLSDGTVVYLNSSTELKYPVHFEHFERKVYLSGEAYFEIAQLGNRPFVVVADEFQVSAYGTEFNVNTHRKDGFQTVLVTGRVGIKANQIEQECLLKPGELAHWNKHTKKLVISTVNVRPYVAWKEGRFAFENERLEEIMQVFSLWYNVEVSFASEDVKELLFTGDMKRYDEITDILHAMTDVVGVKFRMDGRNIIVYK